MRVSSVAACVVLGFVLAGCAPESVTPNPATTVSNTASATPTPTPTAAATRPELSELVVYPGGIDYVKVGVPVELRADDLAVARYNGGGCTSEPARIIGWESTYGPDSFNIVSNEDGTIRGIAVISDEVSSEEGIHNRSTVSDILAAYGETVTVTQDQVNDLYSVTGPDGVLVFEVATDRDFEGGDYGTRVGTVLWMLVLGPGAQPFSIAYGSYGPCV